MAILETKNLRKIYGSGENEVHALDGVSISVNEGEFVAVIGTSGSGKSTLLNMIGGLDRPTSGDVTIRGKQLLKMKDEELTIFRRRNIGFVFQNYNLLPVLNVYENIVYPIEIDGGKTDTEFVKQIIHTLGLEKKLNNMPNNLSGGQQQRVAIARALATKPAIILADEPTGNLDSKTSMDVILLMQSISKQFHQTTIMITHNEEIAQMADRTIRIEDGKVVSGGVKYTDSQFSQFENLEKEIPQFDEHFIEQLSQVNGVANLSTSKITWAEIGFNASEFESFLKMQHEELYHDGKPYEQMISELQEYANAGDYGCYVVTIDDELVEQYNDTHNTPIDIEAFRNGDTVIVGMDTDTFAPNATLVGKTLNLTSDNADGKSADFQVAGAFNYKDLDDNFNIGHRKWVGAVPDVIYVSEAGMERLTDTAIIYDIGVDIESANQLQKVNNELIAINNTLPSGKWNFQSSVSVLEEFNQMYFSIGLLGNGAAILLIVIGLINFVNVMLTGVIARKNEFAIMESIGTTKKQIRKILTFEGGFYALISTILIMTLGNAFLLLVADAVPSIADYARFEYPVALVVGLIIAIFVICLTVPSLVYRFISKETVIERLHDFEN